MNDGERKAWPCGHVRCAGVRRREARGVPVADGMAVATRNAATATRAPRQAKPRVSLCGRVWACVERAADVSTVSSRAGICARGSLVFQGRGDGETTAWWSGVAGQRGHCAKATPKRDGDAARRRGSRVQRARSDLLVEGHASVCVFGQCTSAHDRQPWLGCVQRR